MTSVIRVTKLFSFEMAHLLSNYDGPCKNIHGHSYKLSVTVSGVPVQDDKSQKNGMVIDFSNLKAIIEKEIVNKFDHSVVINKNHDPEKVNVFENLFGNAIFVDYQPTCENLVADFASKIITHLPNDIKLFSVKLHETATSYAEWHSGDNI